MLTLVTGGDVYAPEPRGGESVLVVGTRIANIGEVNRRALEASGLATGSSLDGDRARTSGEPRQR